MLALLLAAMSPTLQTEAIIAESWTKTLVVGHRGAAAYAPENTLPAFEKGIESQAVSVECDVWMSRDRVPMVMHDKTLNRTTDLEGEVAAHDAEAMIKAGVPTLEQLIKTTKGRVNLVVEIKGGEGVEQAVVDMLKKHEIVEETIVFSFGADIVAKVKQLNPKQYSVWLSSKRFTPETLPDLDTQLKTIAADAVGFPYGYVDAPLAAHLRTRKVPLFVWTVPPGPEVDRLRALNVNFIITNHPKDVREQLAKT